MGDPILAIVASIMLAVPFLAVWGLARLVILLYARRPR